MRQKLSVQVQDSLHGRALGCEIPLNEVEPNTIHGTFERRRQIDAWNPSANQSQHRLTTACS